MKILTLILSMYVMLLTGVSCPDTMKSSVTKSTIVKALDSSDSDCQGDLCSPFCSCTCCVGFSKPNSVKVETIIPEVILAGIPYQQKSYTSESYPLFQPPRV